MNLLGAAKMVLVKARAPRMTEERMLMVVGWDLEGGVLVVNVVKFKRVTWVG